MNRPRIVRWLRITWTALCVIAVVLLCVIWVRSYSSMQLWHLTRQHAAMVADGTIMFDGAWMPTDRIAPYEPGEVIQTWDHGPHYIYDRVGGLDIDCWESIVAVVAIGIMPWLSWRFSLRTLLIAIALIAVVLGLIVWSKHKAPSLTAELSPASRPSGELKFSEPHFKRVLAFGWHSSPGRLANNARYRIGISFISRETVSLCPTPTMKLRNFIGTFRLTDVNS